MNVLIVLDDENLKLFEEFFTRNYKNLKTISTNNIRDAFSIIKDNNIVLAIIGLIVGSSNGLEVAEVLKTKDNNTQVLLFGSLNVFSTNIANNDIVDGFIVTPVSEDILCKQISLHLRLYEKSSSILYLQDMFKKMSQEITNILFIVDKNLNITYFNNEFLKSFGIVNTIDKLRKFFPSVIIDFIIEKISSFEEDCTNSFVEFMFGEEHYKINIFNYFCSNDSFIILINVFKPSVESSEYFFSYFKDNLYNQFISYKKLLIQKIPVFKRFSLSLFETLFSNKINGLFYKFLKEKNSLYFTIIMPINDGFSSFYMINIIKEFIENNFYKLKESISGFVSLIQDFYYENKFKEVINVFTGVVDPKRDEMRFCLCGFNSPRILDRTGVISNLVVKEWNFPIGISKNYFSYAETVLELKNIEKFLIFSDEMVEFIHKNGKDTDYFMVDKFLKEGSYKAREELKIIKNSRNIMEKNGLTVIFNFNTPIKDKVVVTKSSSVDRITNFIIESLNKFDFSFSFKRRCFVILEEIVSNMLKYGQGGSISYKIDHEKVIFIFENLTEKTFNPWDYINSIDQEKEELIKQKILNNVTNDSVKLGLYMTEKFSDRFLATKDGKYICSIIKREPDYTQLII